MKEDRSGEKTFAEMLSRCLLEIADNNAHLLTVLDVQARLLASAEGREYGDVVHELNALLKARRRQAIADIEEWTTGFRTEFDGPEDSTSDV